MNRDDVDKRNDVKKVNGLLQKFCESKDLLFVHCVKSVQIRSFYWSMFFYIGAEYRKIRTRKNSVFGHFSRIGGQ